ncbi:FAD/NAD(P)-binding domain-containing protein [Hypoxylon sp. FL0890]|nr:FAD/NAD(P)-binding domain-containing protein [Hypoxylon sp. FL0890]
MANGNFRVIVVGGGPVGLTMANALAKAGIDFVVLEGRPAVTEDQGASLVLGAQSMRVLAQIGILDRLKQIGAEILETRLNTATEGRVYKKLPGRDVIILNHGCAAYMFNRAHLVQAIYDGLSDSNKSRVLTNKKVIDISADESGVSVICKDGTKYDGSIVIGADGVHSIVRKRMRSLALKASPTIDIDEDNPFVSEYMTAWFSFPLQGDNKGGPPGLAWWSHSKDHSAQYLLGVDRAWAFIYERLPAPSRESPRYTEADYVAFMEKWGDIYICDNVQVKDVFPQRYHGGMTILQEGVLKRWTWGRMVLVGDAAHKFTSNQGLGYQDGLNDAVVLANQLYHVLHTPLQNSENKKTENKSDPGLEALSGAFERYQNARIKDAQANCDLSATTTRLSAWRNGFYWFFDWWARPLFPRWLDIWMGNYIFLERVSHGPVLDFVEGEEPFPAGRVPWKYPIPNRNRPATTTKAEGSSQVPLRRILGVFCLLMIVLIMMSGRYRVH